MTPELRRRFRPRGDWPPRSWTTPTSSPVYEAGEVGPVCFIASAYCPGITLADWLRRSEPVPLRLAAAAGRHAGRCRRARARSAGSCTATSSRPTSCSRTCDGDRPMRPERAPGPTRPSGFLVPTITDFGLAKRVEADAETDRQRGHPRHAGLHGPGAGAGQARRDHDGDRRVRPGRGPLRAADRPAPFVGDSVVDTLTKVKEKPPEPPRQVQRRGAARPGGHLPEVPGEGPAAAVRQRPGAGRRPAGLAGGPADRGAAGGRARAGGPVRAAAAGAGGGLRLGGGRARPGWVSGGASPGSGGRPS